MTNVDEQARALYERNTNGSAPPWSNLGEVTRGVWREEVERRGSTEAAFQHLYLNQPPEDHDQET